MSYILNALRKSERERQAIEPDTVTSRIVIQQARQHKSSRGLIAALIVINLGVLLYFLAFAPREQMAIAPPASNLVSPGATPTGQNRPSIARTVAVAAPTPNPAIAGTIENGTLNSPLPGAGKPSLTKTARAKPTLTQPPVVATSKPSRTAEVGVDPATEALPATIAALPPVIQPTELPRQTVEKPTSAKPQSDLPFLEDLPSEVSRSVPVLSINVFSYSTIPTERFVMIDMVKYVPGQSLKDGLQLKEIREDSIVVSYEHYTFKIRRP